MQISILVDNNRYSDADIRKTSVLVRKIDFQNSESIHLNY